MNIIKENFWVYFILLFAAAFFLALEKITHEMFLGHIAAIPLEILVGALLVEKFLDKKEKDTKKPKRRSPYFGGRKAK